MNPEKKKKIELTKAEIDLAGAMASLKSPEIGAIASYFGSARNTSKGKNVDYLKYPKEGSSHVLKKMEEIRINALNKFNIRDVVMIQRLGVLKPGENILFVGISASSRGPAFDACQYIIDQIKIKVHPGWKQEFFKT